MPFIQVTSTELRSKSEELKNLNQRFHSEVESLIAHQNELNTMWEGEAKDAFNNAFNQDKVKMGNFKTLIDQYAQALIVIAARYEEAEKKNLSQAQTRTY